MQLALTPGRGNSTVINHLSLLGADQDDLPPDTSQQALTLAE